MKFCADLKFVNLSRIILTTALITMSALFSPLSEAKSAGSKRMNYLIKFNLAPELKKTTLEKKLKDQLTRRCHSIKDIDPASLRLAECHAFSVKSDDAKFMIFVDIKKPVKKGQWSYIIEMSKRESQQNFKTVSRSQFDEPTKFMRDRGLRFLSEDEIVMVIRDRVISYSFK